MVDYKLYIQSQAWSIKRKQAIDYYHNKCNRCGAPGKTATGNGLECHHLSYANLGNESMDELEILCYKCHNAVHTRRSRLDIITAAIKALAKTSRLLRTIK